MKFICRALCVLLIASCAVRAQDTEESLGDFEPLDDDLVLYIPKFAVKLGFRGIDGLKTSFSGTGKLQSNASIGDPTGVAQRLYDDGYVAFDSRTVVDPAGNRVPITPDGKTNSWAFRNKEQGEVEPGMIAMNRYVATLSDTGSFENDAPAAFGVELTLDREIGSVFGTRMKWGVIGGLSVNQISAETSANLAASVERTRDLYSLNGQAPPTAPFTGPTLTGSVDTTPLLGNEILQRTTITTSNPNAVLSAWKLRGAYVTFRAGPTLFVPITQRFSASFSAGAVVVFSGTTYDVNQSFKPATGDTIVDSMTSSDTALMPGYYVDASLQFAMTDTSGLYLGAVYQSSGDYTQDVTNEDETSTHETRVDLSALQGVRAGVSFKF